MVESESQFPMNPAEGLVRFIVSGDQPAQEVQQAILDARGGVLRQLIGQVITDPLFVSSRDDDVIKQRYHYVSQALTERDNKRTPGYQPEEDILGEILTRYETEETERRKWLKR